MQNNIDIIIDNRGTFSESDNIYWQEGVDKPDSIIYRTDKTKYLTDNEVKQVNNDYKKFEININKMIDGTLSPHTRLIVLSSLPSAYNNIPELKGKKLVITQNIYKKIIDLPNPYKNHNVDRKRAVKLPYLVADPNYILQSNSKGHEDRFEIISNSKGNKKGERLSVIIQPNTDAVIVSAYDEIIDISKTKNDDRVLYNKKKELLKTNVTSKATAINNPNNPIITPSDTNVKYPKQLDAKIHIKIELNIKNNVH